MHLEGAFDVKAPRAVVWERITDPVLMVGCIPGCESIEEVDPKTFKAVIGVSVGIVRARFRLVVNITREDPPNAIHTTTTGEEGTQASMVTATNVMTLTELDMNETRVSWQSDLSLSGRLGKYGLGIMRKRADALSNQFAANFKARLESTAAPMTVIAEPAAKIGIWAKLLGLFRAAPTETNPPAQAFRSQTAIESSVGSKPASSVTSVLKPSTVAEAVSLLAGRDQILPLAGGATLVAMKNAGLADADTFVSLDAIADLKGITVQNDGCIRIGAMTRHRETAACDRLTGSLEVVRQAAAVIANPPVRNMGTIGGSVANADPAADYLPALVCVDAVLDVAGSRGNRRIAVVDYIEDWYTTVLNKDEIIVAIILPKPEKGYSRYRKVARVSGDFATASCAMSAVGEGGDCQIRVAIGGCGPAPLRDRDTEALLSAHADEKTIAAFAEKITRLADPVDDVRGTAEYRRRLIPRLIREALAHLPASEEIA